MDNSIVPAAYKELKTADSETLSCMTEEVLALDNNVRKNNVELDLLDDAMIRLKKSLDDNAKLRSVVQRKMQQVITKL